MVQLLATEALTLRFALADPAACDRELAAMTSIAVAATPMHMTLTRMLVGTATGRPLQRFGTF